MPNRIPEKGSITLNHVAFIGGPAVYPDGFFGPAKFENFLVSRKELIPTTDGPTVQMSAVPPEKFGAASGYPALSDSPTAREPKPPAPEKTAEELEAEAKAKADAEAEAAKLNSPHKKNR